jgi:hypothetical protein
VHLWILASAPFSITLSYHNLFQAITSHFTMSQTEYKDIILEITGKIGIIRVYTCSPYMRTEDIIDQPTVQPTKRSQLVWWEALDRNGQCSARAE